MLGVLPVVLGTGGAGEGEGWTERRGGGVGAVGVVASRVAEAVVVDCCILLAFCGSGRDEEVWDASGFGSRVRGVEISGRGLGKVFGRGEGGLSLRSLKVVDEAELT